MNKRRAQVRHAQRRHLERFGVAVEHGTLMGWVRAIQEGQARFVARQSNRVTVWEYEGKHLVYDKQRKTIVTVLPLPSATEEATAP